MLTSQSFHSIRPMDNNNSWVEPTSPTLSSMSSWVANKSVAEAVGLLKNANATLREKEYDLYLITEIKEYLLQDNMKLHSQYESLMNQIEKDQQLQHYFDQNKLLHQENTLKLSIHDLEDKNMELEQLLESAQNQSSQLQTLHSKKTRALQNDIKLLTNHLNLATQHIEELEQQQNQYTNRTDSEDQNNNNNNNLYQHETLLKELQQHITNLENENNQLIFTKKTVQEKLNHALSQLYQLKQQYQHYEGSQHDYQQLQLAYQQQFDQIHDLHLSLEEHRHLLSITLNNEPDLFHSHHHPIDLIHDNLTTTDSFDSSQHYLGLKQNNNPLYNQLCTTTTITPGKDLMSELENAWRRDRLIDISSDQQQQHHIENNNNNNNKHVNQQENWQMHNNNNNTTSSPSIIIDPFSNTEYHFTDLSCFYYSSEDHHDYENEAELFTTYNHTNHGYKLLHHEGEDDDSHSLFAPIHSNHIPSYNLYPNPTATTMAMKKEEQNKLVVTQNSPVKLIHKVQRWCRFAIVLSMAIAINVIQGPNSMLEKEETEDDKKKINK